MTWASLIGFKATDAGKEWAFTLTILFGLVISSLVIITQFKSTHLLCAEPHLAFYADLELLQPATVLLDSGMIVILDHEALCEGVEVPVFPPDTSGQIALYPLLHQLHSLSTCDQRVPLQRQASSYIPLGLGPGPTSSRQKLGSSMRGNQMSSTYHSILTLGDFSKPLCALVLCLASTSLSTSRMSGSKACNHE